MGLLASGQAELCIAGGVEFCSDQPIRYPRVVRQLLMKGPRARTQESQLEVAGLAKNFNAKAFLPEFVDPREFSSNEVMGEFADRLNVMFGVSREDQGAKYLVFFFFRSLKMREKYISFSHFVYFLREVCSLFNF